MGDDARGGFQKAPALRLWLTLLAACHLMVGTGIAASPVSCDPKGGIWNFGLEWVADTCVPKDMTLNTGIHMVNNALTCSGGKVQLFAPYGDNAMGETPAAIISYGAGNGYRVFRNKEGSHIVFVHQNYTGTIDGKDMTQYAAGQVYTDVFTRGFVLPNRPTCKDVPECRICPCPEKEISSSADLVTGTLSDSHTLFALSGGHQSLALTLHYRSAPFTPSAIGSGWSHTYEQTLQVLANGAAVIQATGRERTFRLSKDNLFVPATGDHGRLAGNADGSHTLTEKDGKVTHFRSDGKFSTITDRNGNTTTATYTSGVLTAVTDPSGRSATFGYDASGKLTTIIDPMGNKYTFTYAAGKVAALTMPDGARWSFRYGSNGLLSGKTDPLNNTTGYSYDASNRVTVGTDPQGQARTVAYGSAPAPGKVPDPFPHCQNTVAIDPANPGKFIISSVDCDGGFASAPFIEKDGSQWSYTFDPLTNTLKSVTDPYGGTTSYSRDVDGNVIAKIEPGGTTAYYTYDTAGNMTTMIDPLGNITSYTYNGFGQMLTSSGPQGKTSNSYDAKGNLTSTTDPSGAITVYEYDTRGNVTRIINAKNQVINLTYDTTGQLTASTGPDEITTTYTYDANGNLLTSSTAGFVTTYTYDAMNRLVRVTDPEGNATGYTYDKNGNRIGQTDANGNTITFAHNYQGQVIRNADALGNPTDFSYGSASGGSCPSCSGVDKITSLTDAKGQTTSYQYDLMSRLNSETDPLGKTTTYTYDSTGTLKTKTDPNGAISSYSHDLMKRLTRKSYPDQTTETFSYDPAGRMLTAANKDISYSYTYDTAGHPTRVTDSRGFTLDHEYDILGTKTKTTLGKGTPDEHIISYTYDYANRPSTITSSSGTFAYSYDSRGRRSSVTYPTGITTRYGYDDLNRLTSIKHTAGAATITFANYSGFDKVGNRKAKATASGMEQYNYDPTYRLIQAITPQGTESYGYDQVGNRLSGPGPKDTRYTYNAGNQQTMGRIYGHDYDNNGNQISRTTANTDKSWTYKWDYENRLIASEQTKGTEKKTVTFEYDPQGRRIKKLLTTVIPGQTNTSSWDYIYDGDSILLELHTNEAGRTEKTWYTHGAGIDEHLALERIEGNFYYHADGLGSITAITDANKRVVQTYQYDSFGNTHQSTGFRNSYMYTGREWDKETGLYYYRARYYDAMDGRFISKDPIGFYGGNVALYSYINNNSTNFIDPYGLDATTFLGDRRSIYDGPKNGNWGGKNWSGGRNPKRNGGFDGPLPPTDSADICYMNHDRCYAFIDKQSCNHDNNHKKVCNLELLNCLNKLSHDPRKWLFPPRLGTEKQSEAFRIDATAYFTLFD